MRQVKLKEGEFVRIKGWVKMISSEGGSSWTEKNPLILLGKCKHKPKVRTWINNWQNQRIYCKGRIVCSKCGDILRFEKDFNKKNIERIKKSLEERKKGA